MGRATVVLEGITVQHAGELIFDMGSTPASRREGRDIYLAALEDFAFAYLFGEQVAVSRNLPKVGRDEPGKQLLSALPPATILDVELAVDQASPRTMLETRQERDSLLNCIGSLPDVVRRDFSLWTQFMVREARSYLGSDVSLADPALPRDAYVFAKRTQGDASSDYHLKDGAAESWIDAAVVTLLVDAIKGAGAHGTASDNALSAFVTRTILTHVQIFIWYRAAARLTRRVTNVLRILYPTRSRLESNLREYQRVRRLMVPHALRLALSQSLSRGEFLDNLHDLRFTRDIEEVAGDFGDALRAAGAGNARLSDDIGRRVREGVEKVAQDKVQNVTTGTELTVGISPTASGSVGHETATHVLPADSWARLVSGYRFETYTAREYQADLERVFPELAPR